MSTLLRTPAVQASSDLLDRAADPLGPKSELFADPDVARFGSALASATMGLARHPVKAAQATARCAGAVAGVAPVVLARALGRNRAGPFVLDPRDRRFADPTWTDNPMFFAMRQYYLALGQLTEQLIGAAELDPLKERKAQMAAAFAVDLISPTNFLATNPAALKRAFETGGRSVLQGGRNVVEDLVHNGGRPRQVDTSSFVLGENLAATAGKVVYRNELMELIQYQPQTELVHSSPLLCSPPWINKFYVMDLAPGRSFIEWAVRQNRTVFAISYLNPGPEMSAATMEDYLLKGPKVALDVIAEITGADTIDIVGLCLGGALTAITDAYLTQLGDSPVGTLTLLNTMLDYSEPGALGVFADAATVDRLAKKMVGPGFLPAASMAAAFDFLRPKDLIFNYVASNWLMGQDPPAFDILAWNADSTRMPAAMHEYYLRNFYVENRLAAGRLHLGGQRIALDNIKKETYIVSADNDHIVPWRSAYASTQLVSGPVRFVLTSGGHIAGIVNPPAGKGWYLTGDELPSTADGWRSGATKHSGSWWEDWANWSAATAGELVPPPRVGSVVHPVLGPAPGGYVRT